MAVIAVRYRCAAPEGGVVHLRWQSRGWKQFGSMATHSYRPYRDDFYDWVDRSAARSAQAFVPRVAGLLVPASVLDVGCGRGAWLRAWIAQPGVDRVRGIDGDYVDHSRLAISARCLAPSTSNPIFRSANVSTWCNALR
jgi:SAM-dependent methyltransferase